MAKVDFTKFANGALMAKLDKELEKVLDNIYDANTDPKKARKITAVITLHPSVKREQASVDIDVKSTLAPQIPIEARIVIDRDFNTGTMVAAELKADIPGQIEIDLPDEKPVGDNIVDLQKAHKAK